MIDLDSEVGITMRASVGEGPLITAYQGLILEDPLSIDSKSRVLGVVEDWDVPGTKFHLLAQLRTGFKGTAIDLLGIPDIGLTGADLLNDVQRKMEFSRIGGHSWLRYLSITNSDQNGKIGSTLIQAKNLAEALQDPFIKVIQKLDPQFTV